MNVFGADHLVWSNQQMRFSLGKTISPSLSFLYLSVVFSSDEALWDFPIHFGVLLVQLMVMLGEGLMKNIIAFILGF